MRTTPEQGEDWNLEKWDGYKREKRGEGVSKEERKWGRGSKKYLPPKSVVLFRCDEKVYKYINIIL